MCTQKSGFKKNILGYRKEISKMLVLIKKILYVQEGLSNFMYAIEIGQAI